MTPREYVASLDEHALRELRGHAVLWDCESDEAARLDEGIASSFLVVLETAGRAGIDADDLVEAVLDEGPRRESIEDGLRYSADLGRAERLLDLAAEGYPVTDDARYEASRLLDLAQAIEADQPGLRRWLGEPEVRAAASTGLDILRRIGAR